VEAGEAGPRPVALVSDAPNAWLIATDGTSVYWIDWITTDAGQQNGRIMQVGVDGGGRIHVHGCIGRKPPKAGRFDGHSVVPG